MKKIVVATLLAAASVCAGVYSSADVTGKPHDLRLDNPKGHCINCHDLHQPKLGQGYAHNLKRANEIAVCYQCHAGTLSNYSSIDKSYPSYPNVTGLYSKYDIRSEFSQQHIHFPTYGMDGEHNKCSYCHNPHGVFDHTSTTRKPKLLSAGQDAVTDTDDYCLVCHNNDSNPPHLPFPNISVGAQYRFSRTVYKQMRHSTFVRATSLTEPVPDTARTYDDNPYGSGKDISCLTCHRPHGSANDHMLKSADNQDFCLECHNGSKAPDLTTFNTSGHGKPGVGRICQECHFPHGTGQENAVKKTITDPHTLKNMTADVNARGMNDACFACHSAAGGSVPIYYGFDGTASGWTAYGLTQSVDSATYYAGSGSLKQVQTTTNSYYSYTDYLTAEPNTAYTAAAYLKMPASLSSGSATFYLYQYNSSNGSTGTITVVNQSAATAGWKRFSYSFTSSASTAKIRLYLYLTGVGTAYWDEVQVYKTQAGSYYQGKAAYNSGIHKTSANAHNPEDTAGDHAAGDCGNCHDPHGKSYEKMLVDTGQVLCYDCHNSTTHNTASGADVQAAFQSASRHDLTKVKCTNCHNVHKATQTAVMMEPYYPGATISDRSLFCLACHSGTMPSGVTGAPNVGVEWNGGGHDKTHTLTCSDCHNSHGSPNPNTLNSEPKVYAGYTAGFSSGLSFSSRAFCEKCHNRTGSGYKGAKKIPTGSQYVAQHAQGDPKPCADCHAMKHNPTLGSYTGSSTYYTTACLTCHTEGVGNPYPYADAEFNTPSNPADANTRRSVHAINYSPPSSVDCTVCHGSKHESDHSATNKIKDPDSSDGLTNMSSIRTNNNFCLQCHDATPVNIGGQTPPNILNTYTAAGHGMRSAGVLCSACHAHHGSVNEKLLKTTINGSPVMPNYSGNNVSVCIACHRGTDANVPNWPGYSVYSGSVHALGNPTTGNYASDGRHGRGVCVNCHNPHGSRVGGKTAESMLYKSGEDLCYNCHNGTTPNTASGDNIQARFGMATRHNISDADQKGPDGLAGTADDSKVECVDCHDPHTITERLMAFKGTSDLSGRHVQPVEADQEFCLKCHGVTPPEGIKFPQQGVWDKSQYEGSAHGNPLKRIKTFGNYSNGVSYACKVCHNPHGSDQAALQRETWDIDRDGLPDDIDGDGVLDSTDKVGFIGYSTGTRKPLLVKTKDGIPSRSTFKRVSSTIPKQSNGSIDIELCLNCHDGTPAYDVKTDMKKKSHHPVEFTQQSSLGGAKIECYNCHDQHRAQARNDAMGEYPTTNPDPPREPMSGDAKFCLRCHDNVLPEGVSFGGVHLKNIKLSYNPNDLRDAKGYDLITSNQGHFVQATGTPLMCRVCHNQHGSNYPHMLRDNTEPSKPGYDPTQPIQGINPVTLRSTDAFGGSDNEPLSSPAERCLACHSGGTTYEGNLIPLPPPPDSEGRGFTPSSVGKHPDLKPEVTSADEVNGHIYKNTFAIITSPGSIKEACTVCHDSHDPLIKTVGGELMDCYQCHNQNTALPDVQTEFNDNPLNSSRSKSIHPIKYDPSGQGPAYVECLKCHDQSKHMQGKVRLRKDPAQFLNYTSDADVWADPVANRTINQFCLECHAPDTTVASNFNRGGSGHVPPKLPDGHADGAHFQNGDLLCSDCHEYHGSTNRGLRKNERGDEETFCYSCHSDPAKSKDGINIQAKFTGSGSRHDLDAGSQAANGSKVECENCHNPHLVNRTSSVVQPGNTGIPAVADDAFCIGCHGSSPVSAIKFPGYSTGTTAPEWDATTGKWNRWNKGAYTGSPHENGGVGCLKCHDPHGTPNHALLLQNISASTGISVSFGMHSTARGKRKEEVGVNRVCASCHKSAMGVYDGYASFSSLTFGHRRGVDKNCTYCHNPHGTGQANLIRSNRTLYMNMTSRNFGSVYNFKGFVNRTTGAPYYAFCSSRGCHASERTQYDTFNMDLPVDNYTNHATSSSHHPIKEGTITCTSCHKEHGTSTNATDYLSPDLRAPFFRGSNWPLLWRSGVGRYISYCYECYSFQHLTGNDYFEPATTDSAYSTRSITPNMAKVVNTTPPSNANDLCFMCHQKDDVIGTAADGMTGTNTKFIGHEAIAGGARMTKQISRMTAIPANGEYHNFSCSACHFPHATSQNKLLKTGCMSRGDNMAQSDYEYNTSHISLFQCHAYTSPNSTYASYKGWRNLTTSAKTDFERPHNIVTDLSASSNANLDITLTWRAVADDKTGQGAHHYNVYRSSQSITQATKVYATRIYKGVAGAAAESEMNWTDYTGQPNTIYYYAVVACDAQNNESLVSNCASVSLGQDTIPPSAISTQQIAQIHGTLSVKITWNDPGDNVNVTQYKVYRAAGASPPEITPGNLVGSPVSDSSQSSDGSADTNLYSLTDTPGSVGSQFSYAVIAYDQAGNASALPTGSVFNITIVDPPPAAVTTLAVKPQSMNMKADLSWSAPQNVGAISGYNVYRKSGSAPSQSELTPSFRLMSSVGTLAVTDDNVPSKGSDYYYAVTAIDGDSRQQSLLGNTPSVNIPFPPSGVAAAKMQNSVVQIWWSAPSVTANFTSYKVYWRRNLGSWTYSTSVTSVSQLSTTINMAGMEPGSYDFAVSTAYSTYGGTAPYESNLSDPASVSIVDTSKPADFTVSSSLTSSSNYTQARLSWNAPSDQNFSGYTPAGVEYYTIKASYDQGSTWAAIIKSRLMNPGLEQFSGTKDDGYTDSFTSWSQANTYTYAVSDALYDSTAMKIIYTGSGDRYVYAVDPTYSAVKNQTYSLSFWAKANKNTSFEFFIQEYGGSYQRIGTVSNASVGPMWKRYTTTGTFSSTASANQSCIIIRPSSDTSAYIILDGVRFDGGSAAIQPDDGTYCQPSGYNVPGTALTFDDPKVLTGGTSARYSLYAVDSEGNFGNAASTSQLNAKPSTITDLEARTDTAKSANILYFSVPNTLTGLSRYDVYAKEQSSPLTSLAGATLIGTLTPSVTNGGNMAGSATASASYTYSNYYASNVKDGNTSTMWLGRAGDTVQLTLPSIKWIKKVGFVFYNNSYYMPKDYLIQTYNGSSWVTQVTVTGNTNATPTHTLPTPVYTDKVRLYITTTGGYVYGYVYEFQVYPGETYTHDEHNTSMVAEVGRTYSYAVIATDTSGFSSDISSGSPTYLAVIDRDAPAKVTDLAVTSEPGTTQAVLTWTTPLDNYGLGTNSGAVTYEVYRSPASSTGTAVPITDANFGDTGSVALVYTGTYASSQAGTQNSYTATWYDHSAAYFAVRSADASGNWSEVSTGPDVPYVIVGKDIQAPSPPVVLSCTPAASPEMDVLWSPAVDNECSVCGVNGYRLFRADSNAEPFKTDGCINENNIGAAQIAINLIPYNYTQIADNGGTPGTTYFYGLKAWDNEGNMSNISNCGIATVATTAADTTAPTWGGGSPLTVLQKPYPDIDLIWTAATDLDNSSNPGTIDRYEVYRSLTSFASVYDAGVSKIADVAGIKNSYIDNTGDHDTTYYYAIVAVDASANHNWSALSNVASATVAVAPSPDNTLPTVPGALAASTGVYPYINLSWTASTDVDNAGSPQDLLYYKLYRSEYPLDITDANKDNTSLVRTFILANDAVECSNTGTGDMEYNYRLEAFDLAGNASGMSSQVMAHVASAPCVDTTPPTAPANLAATIGPSPDMALSWTASSDTGACSGLIDHYHLYRSAYEITASTDLGTMTPITIAGNVTAYTDSSGAPNTTYWYVLTAVDSAQKESVRSNIITKTTAADTMAPAAINDLKATPVSGGTVHLTWCKPSDNVGVDHYEIYRKEQSTILQDADITSANRIANFQNAGVCLSYDDSGRASGSTYSYAVIAVDGAGNRSTISRGQNTGDTIATALP